MATSRREAASSRRRLGAAVFNERYAPVPDVSMPRVAPEEEELREGISLGQGDGGFSLNPVSSFEHERHGFEYNPEFVTRMNQLRNVRADAMELDTLVDLVRGLPSGFRIAPTYDLRGLSIGEIVSAIQSAMGPNALRGLYLDADVVNLNLVGAATGHLDQNGRPIIHFNHSMTNYQTRRLPLWQVRPVLPRSIDFPHGFQGGDMEERRDGFETTMRIMNGDAVIAEELGISADEDGDLESVEGSDVSSYYILANARLVRRARAPEYIDNRTSLIRTGGFSELLTETNCIRIGVDEVVDAYIEHEKLKVSEFNKEYVEEFRGILAQLFTVDIFTRPDREITLIVPGGSEETMNGGCCVDSATYEYLKEEVGEETARVYMGEIRERFENLYVEWRAKRREFRKRGREESDADVAAVIVLPEERKTILRDLRKVTACGYSSQIFRFYQTAVYCVSGYLPCIYYHRVEKARDYNDGVRVRMVQVGSGVTSRILIEDFAKEAVVSDDVARRTAYNSINMLRINLNGEIHRHRPKSLCCEDTTEFISDDDSTGLLHAITVHPSLPDEFFGGVNAKRREVLFSVIEKKTMELMDRYKRGAVGMAEVTSTGMEEAVREQLRRHDRGVTNTLIYGKIGRKEVIRAESQQVEAGENLRRSHEVSWGSEGAPLFYSNCYDLEGRKVPERPLVIVYDLETVELTSEAVQAGVVGEEFIRESPDRSKYMESERQIPFCVSWVPVNLSDEGGFLALKQSQYGRGEAISAVRKEEEWAGSWEHSNSYVFCDDGRRVRIGYIMLDAVKVHYGGKVLGRCVSEFIDAVMKWGMERGYTSVLAYAHNGVGFDSYVMQAFNTKYEYQSILKTSRGILSMKMRVPFTTKSNQRKNFPITFLDTKVFLSFSLAKLCRDFHVPLLWAKLDFPITKITWKNCYHPSIVEVLEPYSINDARALAFIVKQINRIVCLESKVTHILGSDELPVEVYESLL